MTYPTHPLYPPKTYTLQVSCKTIRRTAGGLTLPSLLTVKVWSHTLHLYRYLF